METNHIWLSCAHYVAIYLSVFDRRFFCDTGFVHWLLVIISGFPEAEKLGAIFHSCSVLNQIKRQFIK